MQIYSASLGEDGRPCAGSDCPRCGGCARLHKHGTYVRWRGVEGQRRESVQRYICPRCQRTWSVIPAGLLPYRSMEVDRMEALFDERLTGGGARPPLATEKEEGFIRRALKKLSKRIPFLCGLLGQQMPLLAGEDIYGFWRAMRELGSTQSILLRLARDFKTSLLGCYRSLRAFWERESVPVAVR